MGREYSVIGGADDDAAQDCAQLGRESADLQEARQRSAVPALEQLAIAMLCHPLRAGKMAVIHLAGAFGFLVGVDLEQNLADFMHAGAAFDGVEQAQVERHMRVIIVGQVVTARCKIRDWHGAIG